QHQAHSAGQNQGSRPPFARILTGHGDAATTLSTQVTARIAAALTSRDPHSTSVLKGECFALRRANYLFTSESVWRGIPTRFATKYQTPSSTPLSTTISNSG